MINKTIIVSLLVVHQQPQLAADFILLPMAMTSCESVMTERAMLLAVN